MNFTGATITSLGALDVTGGALNVNSGTAASLAQTGGTLGGAGKLTVSGAATFSGSQYMSRPERGRRCSGTT